jgi:hypothetical protein
MESENFYKAKAKIAEEALVVMSEVSAQSLIIANYDHGKLDGLKTALEIMFECEGQE